MKTQALPKWPAYAMNPAQMESRVRDLQRRFPDLVEVRDIGDSAAKVNGKGGHDILAVVLTDKNSRGPKTSTLHVGGTHGNELTNPTLLTEFAEQLAGGFGRDAQSTHWLKSQEIHLVPILNPDGVSNMEKLLNGDKESPWGRPNGNGVNLNRNFPTGWGGNGADIMPGSGNYRGPAPASEPETQALISYGEKVRPTMFFDWHNYSELNLYGWGETPKTTALARDSKPIADRIAHLNQHKSIKAYDLYPVTGSTSDWALGSLKMPGFVMETGNEKYLTDAEYANVRRKNMPVLFDLTSIGSDPINLSKGPVAEGAGIGDKDLAGWFTETRTGGQAIKGAELVFNPRQKAGTGLKFKPEDGKWDSTSEGAIMKTPRIPRGADMGYVRAKDSKGNWGALTPFWIKNPEPAPPRDD